MRLLYIFSDRKRIKGSCNQNDLLPYFISDVPFNLLQDWKGPDLYPEFCKML